MSSSLDAVDDLILQCKASVFIILSGDIESGKKLRTIPGGRKGTEDRHVGHTTHILSMAVSSDGKYLVRIPALLLAFIINCRSKASGCDSSFYISIGHWRYEQADHDLGSRNM